MNSNDEYIIVNRTTNLVVFKGNLNDYKTPDQAYNPFLWAFNFLPKPIEVIKASANASGCDVYQKV